jgi:tRNA(fMet)-specific endonuclease VapC
MIFIDTDLAIGFLSKNKTKMNQKAKNVLKTLFKTHDHVCLTVINQAELIRGAYLSSNPAKSIRIIKEFIHRFDQVEFDENAVRQYALIYADLKKRGQSIGDFDELIASIVVANDGVIYTRNTDHFGRIPLLQLEDWGI